MTSVVTNVTPDRKMGGSSASGTRGCVWAAVQETAPSTSATVRSDRAGPERGDDRLGMILRL